MSDIVENMTAGEAIKATEGNSRAVANLYGLKYVPRGSPVAAQIIEQAVSELGTLNDEITALRARIAQLEASIADEREDAAQPQPRPIQEPLAMTPTETQIARAERIVESVVGKSEDGSVSTAHVNIALAAIMECEAWRDIESAPKDGTRVDLWMVDETGAGWREANAYWVTNYDDERINYQADGSYNREYYKRDGWFAPNHDYDGAGGWCDVPRHFNSHPRQNKWIFIEATHWRPLPAPPIAAAIRAGVGDEA